MSKKEVFVIFAVVSVLTLLTFQTFAQDTTPTLEAGKYTVAASFPLDVDVTKVCAFRTDTKVELKCVTVGLNQTTAADNLSAMVTAADGRKYRVRPPSPTGRVALIQDIDLVNVGANVRIGFRAEDAGGNSSESTNVAVVDFTPPTPPVALGVTSEQ